MSRLVERGIARTLVSMAVPMLAGTFALNAYNLADTWHVARLGTGPLAAMSFTFPVVMFLGFFLRGIGTGAMAVVAHALGGNRQEHAATVATHAALLSAMVGLVLAVAGWFSIRPIFTRLGAAGEVLDMAAQYMRIWYLGLVFRALHLLFNDVVIATGHTKACTVFSEAAVMAGGFLLLSRRYRLLAFRRSTAAAVLASWGRVLRIGAPSTLSSVLIPLSTGALTRMIAGFGAAADGRSVLARPGSGWWARAAWATLLGMEPDIDLPSKVFLEVTGKEGEVARFPITKKTVTIGRDPGCDLRLADPCVSRKHCQVVFRGDHFTVMDLGSLNKTVVKGKQYIQKNLMPGNELTLGQTRLRFVWDGCHQWRREHGVVEEPVEEGPTEEGQPDPGGPGPHSP